MRSDKYHPFDMLEVKVGLILVAGVIVGSSGMVN